MPFQPGIRAKIELELDRGMRARGQGLEGQARVCARRAAGAAARAYLEGKGRVSSVVTAFDALQLLALEPGLSDRAAQALGALLERVNESYELPGGADLLEEARILAEALELAED